MYLLKNVITMPMQQALSHFLASMFRVYKCACVINSYIYDYT